MKNILPSSFTFLQKRKSIVLHIGVNKAGSTALQAWCDRNRELLKREAGLLYPDTGKEGAAHYGLSRLTGFSHGGRPAPEAERNDFSMRFARELKNSDCKTALFSSENFVLNKDPVIVQNLFEGYECTILVYLRRHDTWWESGYKQAVKMVNNPLWGRGIRNFIEFNRTRNPKYGNYRHMIDKWAAVFGKDRIVVRPFERSQMPDGIVVDTLGVLGLDKAIMDRSTPQERLNRSFSKRASFILDVAQRAELGTENIAKLLRYLEETDTEDDGFSLLPPRMRARLIMQNQSDYIYIAKHYLGLEDGGLFHEPIPAETDEWHPFEPPKIEEIVAVIASAIG